MHRTETWTQVKKICCPRKSLGEKSLCDAAEHEFIKNSMYVAQNS